VLEIPQEAGDDPVGIERVSRASSRMDKRHFDQLVKGVRKMKRHMVGKAVRGARVTTLSEPGVRAIRERLS
jgi:hypothetical protein